MYSCVFVIAENGLQACFRLILNDKNPNCCLVVLFVVLAIASRWDMAFLVSYSKSQRRWVQTPAKTRHCNLLTGMSVELSKWLVNTCKCSSNRKRERERTSVWIYWVDLQYDICNDGIYMHIVRPLLTFTISDFQCLLCHPRIARIIGNRVMI